MMKEGSHVICDVFLLTQLCKHPESGSDRLDSQMLPLKQGSFTHFRQAEADWT